MIQDINEIKEFFIKLDKIVSCKINIYTIGGAVLLERGLKAATKDVDLIVSTKKEFRELNISLLKMGFIGKIPGIEYSRMNLSQIFQKGDFRIDLFEKEVCGRFSLSKGMMERAKPILNLTNVNLYFCSNEDIFLFKTITERDGDLIDCENLVFAAVNWDIILDELKSQIEESKQDVWVTWVGERLDLLEERGMIIPIMKQVDALREKFFEEFERRSSKD
jgi:hypothetical protein